MVRRTFYALAVDTSAKFTKDVYYCTYKGLEWKFEPSKNLTGTDNLLMAVDLKEHTLDEARGLICEFWSGLSFKYDFRTILKGGLINNRSMNLRLSEVNIKSGEFREIIANDIMDDFIYCPIIETKEQRNILALYRIANSNNDTYSKLLFYWHTLVYPSSNDKDAKTYINENYLKIEYLKDSFEYVLKNQIFNKNGNDKDLGLYIHSNVRNAIAHIVRSGNSKSLDIDNLEEIRHLNEIVRILKELSRYKIKNDAGFDFNQPNPHFQYFDP